jgi:hypothetical protein
VRLGSPVANVLAFAFWRATSPAAIPLAKDALRTGNACRPGRARGTGYTGGTRLAGDALRSRRPNRTNRTYATQRNFEARFVTGLIRFLAVEGQVKLGGGRAGFDFDSLVDQAAIKPCFDPVGDIDADEITDGSDG